MRFASRDWVEALVAALNAQPELATAIRGLGADAGFVVERDGPAWPRDVTAWARHERGRIASFRLLPDPDDLLELEPAYVVRAPYRIWRDLLAGGDPVQAALSGRVKVEGDLEALVRRSGYRHVVDAALAAVRTEFP